jgi:hypothetical protein
MKAAEHYLNIATANGMLVLDEQTALEAIELAIKDAQDEVSWVINNLG